VWVKLEMYDPASSSNVFVGDGGIFGDEIVSPPTSSISIAGERGTFRRAPLSGDAQVEGQGIQGVARVLPAALGKSAELRWNQ
jgi:hypothetical protein